MTETSDRWLAEHNVAVEDLQVWSNVVLAWGGKNPGWEPSTWEQALLRLLSVSDSTNTTRLFVAFPAAVAAWLIWKEGDRSELERLSGRKRTE